MASEHCHTLLTCLNLRVQSGCRVLNLLDEPGHVLEEEVVKVLLLHVLELEHGLAGGLGGHGGGVAEAGVGTEAATVSPTLTLASAPGQYELTRGGDTRLYIAPLSARS